MKVVFVGESPSRVLTVAGRQVEAVNGVPIDVPEDVARSLLEQETWIAAPKAAPKKEQG